MDYKSMTIEDIIKWCQENNQVMWLKETAKKETPILDEEGNPVLNKKGVPRVRKISFIEIKMEFVKKFMPDIAPDAKPKKPSMYDRIANL